MSLAVLATVAAGLVICVYLVVFLFTHSPRKPYDSELEYITNGIAGRFKLPPRNSAPSDNIEISVVVPCFNEHGRLRAMLSECIEHLEARLPGQYEIIIVDDGSSDGTAQYAVDLAAELGLRPHVLRVVQFVKNRGKGGAVTHGMQFGRGKYAIFADADGASKFSDVDKLLENIKRLDRNEPETRAAVAIGSRAHMVNTDAVVKRSFVRNFLMYALHALVFVFGIRTIKDTQCGFKLFNKAAVAKIFPKMHTEGWIFDVELLILAINQHIPVDEIAISWHEVDGSKMVLARDSITMAIDLVVTRLAYILGIY